MRRVIYTQGIMTLTQDAMSLARTDIILPNTNTNNRQLVIVITDGNAHDYPQVARVLLKQAGLRFAEGLDIFAIGIGDGISDYGLLQIAEYEENILRVRDYIQLEEITEDEDSISAIGETQQIAIQDQVCGT